jgi:hypothetical protein
MCILGVESVLTTKYKYNNIYNGSTNKVINIAKIFHKNSI